MNATVSPQLVEECSAVLRAVTLLRTDTGPPPLWTVLLVPAVSASLAIAGAWIAIAFDRRKSTNQELIKKRISVFDDMMPKLNDLICFANSVGSWRALTPTIIIDHKRALDRSFHIYRAMFSLSFAAAYTQLIEECYFSTWQGPGAPPRLRLSVAQLKLQWGAQWNGQWDAHFVPSESASPSRQIIAAYEELMHQFSTEVGGRSPTPRTRPSRPLRGFLGRTPA